MAEFGIKLVMNGPAKNYHFWWVYSSDVIFKMPLELPQSEVCGKSYGHFTETTQNGLKTDTLVFSSHFGNPIV